MSRVYRHPALSPTGNEVIAHHSYPFFCLQSQWVSPLSSHDEQRVLSCRWAEGIGLNSTHSYPVAASTGIGHCLVPTPGPSKQGALSRTVFPALSGVGRRVILVPTPCRGRGCHHQVTQIQFRPSRVIAVNIFSADRSPKGRVASMKSAPTSFGRDLIHASPQHFLNQCYVREKCAVMKVEERYGWFTILHNILMVSQHLCNAP